MVHKIFFRLAFICFFLLKITLFAQEQGNFNIQNYSPKEYGAYVQNWGVVQDNRGAMYFANGDGVLKYDGSDWQLIKISNSSAARSIAKNSAGDIFIGAIGDFGYLKNGAKGKTEFFSLNSLLDEKDRENLEIWFTKTVNDDVYFCALRAVYRYRNGQIEVFKTADDIISCFVFKEQLYIYEFKVGIKKFTDKGFVLTPNGEYFKDKPFRFVVEYDSSKLIVGTYNGLSLLDMDSFNSSSTTPFVSWFKTDFDSTIRNSFPYHGIRLKNGNFALCLLPYGLLIIDKNGKTRNFFNKEMGLQTESVTSAFEDFENNLWLTLTKGISKIEYSSPFTFWNEKDSFELVNDIVRHKNKLYVGCINGLFALDDNKIKVVNSYRSPVFSLLKFKKPNHFNEEILLIGTEFDGLISIEKDKFRPLINTNSVIYTMFQSKKDPSLLYIGLPGSIIVAQFKNNGFKVIGEIEGVTKEVRKIVEQSDGTLWCSNQTNYTLRITPSENPIKPKSLKEFTSNDGIIGYQSLACYNDKILIGTDAGVLCLNETKDRFILDSSFDKEFGYGTIKDLTLLQIENQEDIWIQGIRNKQYGLGIKNIDCKYIWHQTTFNALPESSSPLTFIESDTTIWIATNDEIFRYKGGFIRAFPSYKTMIKKIFIGKDSLIYTDGDSINQLIKQINYKNNSISFLSGALTFFNEKSTSYQTFLEGFDNNWSNWTKDPKREFTNLPEGTYKFHTRAKNIYDKIGDEDVFEFVILTPWYRSILAYLVYLIILVGIVILVIKIYTRNLKAANIKLESIIEQRTNEIQKQRDELLVLNSTKDKFFGIIAHDLRNPFNSILGFSELIMDKLKKEDVKTSLIFMQHMHKASTAAYELLDNLLTWSRSQSGIIQFKPETLNIKKQIDYTILMLEGAAQIKGVKLSSNLMNTLFIFADINMILTVLRNLLTNAIKFSNEGDRVTIDAKELNNKIIVSVTDTGIGISESMIKKLFRVEEHVKSEGTASEAGTGLGLILCKEFVEKNGGEIWVKSKVGEGSCFSFTLKKGYDN